MFFNFNKSFTLNKKTFLKIVVVSKIWSYEKQNILFYEKHLKLTKNNAFNNVYAIEFFFAITSCKFFKSDWIFINHGFFFNENIL